MAAVSDAPRPSQTPASTPADPPTTPSAPRPRARRRRPHVGPALLLVACVVYFVVPLVAMARFGFQSVPMARLGWSNLFEGWTLRGLRRAFTDDRFIDALLLSVRLAAATVVLNTALLLPTALWTHLRVPRLRPLVEAITLLPWVVPPIALVVGVAGTFRTTMPSFLSSDWSLAPFYAVLAMPFTYRALDAGLRAIDLATLTEAARGLGAGWWTTMFRVVVPNLRAALVASSFLTITVVLGEFTIAALLLKPTLPTYLAIYQREEPQGGMALALVALVATALLLLAFNAVARRRPSSAAAAALTV